MTTLRHLLRVAGRMSALEWACNIASCTILAAWLILALSIGGM